MLTNEEMAAVSAHQSAVLAEDGKAVNEAMQALDKRIIAAVKAVRYADAMIMLSCMAPPTDRYGSAGYGGPSIPGMSAHSAPPSTDYVEEAEKRSKAERDWYMEQIHKMLPMFSSLLANVGRRKVDLGVALHNMLDVRSAAASAVKEFPSPDGYETVLDRVIEATGVAIERMCDDLIRDSAMGASAAGPASYAEVPLPPFSIGEAVKRHLDEASPEDRALILAAIAEWKASQG